MGSPAEQMVIETPNNRDEPPESDDDEDVTVHRKPRCRNALSDSEEEEAAGENSVHMAEALVLSASSGEEDEKDKRIAKEPQKSKRISRAPIDSEESEPDREKAGEVGEQQQEEEVKKEVKPVKERKKREKSQRHHEKKEKHSKAVEKLKKKERFSERNEDTSLPRVLNDSGCPLGDTDLFDNGLGGGDDDDDNDDEEEEEEESLDAIRAAIKQKMEKHKDEEEEGDEDALQKPHRVERKAARASKEAMKQLHSESQRLIRGEFTTH